MLESKELLTEYEFDEIGNISSHGYIPVRRENMWSVLNHRGEMITDFNYDFTNVNDKPPYPFIGEWYTFIVYKEDIPENYKYGVYCIRSHNPTIENIFKK